MGSRWRNTGKKVFGHVLAQWPEAITPQILRSRLFGFKRALCDANFRTAVCACCACETEGVTSQKVEFPTRHSARAPSWLPWSDAEWCKHRDAWFAQVDEILSTDVYLQDVFNADEEILRAGREVQRIAASLVKQDSSAPPSVAPTGGRGNLRTHLSPVLFEPGSPSSPTSFTTVAAAEAWLRRVETWRSNLHKDLVSDCVPAPG